MTTQPCGQIYKPLRVGDDAVTQLDGHLPYGVLPLLAIMRLWFACLTESFAENITNRGARYFRAVEAKALQDAADIASGKTRAPALIPESARVAEAPKIMLGRRAKRILARGLPACRQYGWFRFASPSALTGNQFFELVARLSVNGRMGVYRLEYKRRLCVRRPSICQRIDYATARFGRLNAELSTAFLWPD